MKDMSMEEALRLATLKQKSPSELSMDEALELAQSGMFEEKPQQPVQLQSEQYATQNYADPSDPMYQVGIAAPEEQNQIDREALQSPTVDALKAGLKQASADPVSAVGFLASSLGASGARDSIYGAAKGITDSAVQDQMRSQANSSGGLSSFLNPAATFAGSMAPYIASGAIARKLLGGIPGQRLGGYFGNGTGFVTGAMLPALLTGVTQAAGSAGKFEAEKLAEGINEEDAKSTANQIFSSQAPVNTVLNAGASPFGLPLGKSVLANAAIGGAYGAARAMNSSMTKKAAESSIGQGTAGFVDAMVEETKNIGKHAKEALPSAVAGAVLGGVTALTTKSSNGGNFGYKKGPEPSPDQTMKNNLKKIAEAVTKTHSGENNPPALLHADAPVPPSPTSGGVPPVAPVPPVQKASPVVPEDIQPPTSAVATLPDQTAQFNFVPPEQGSPITGLSSLIQQPQPEFNDWEGDGQQGTLPVEIPFQAMEQEQAPEQEYTPSPETRQQIARMEAAAKDPEIRGTQLENPALVPQELDYDLSPLFQDVSAVQNTSPDLTQQGTIEQNSNEATLTQPEKETTSTPVSEPLEDSATMDDNEVDRLAGLYQDSLQNKEPETPADIQSEPQLSQTEPEPVVQESVVEPEQSTPVIDADQESSKNLNTFLQSRKVAVNEAKISDLVKKGKFTYKSVMDLASGDLEITGLPEKEEDLAKVQKALPKTKAAALDYIRNNEAPTPELAKAREALIDRESPSVKEEALQNLTEQDIADYTPQTRKVAESIPDFKGKSNDEIIAAGKAKLKELMDKKTVPARWRENGKDSIVQVHIPKLTGAKFDNFFKHLTNGTSDRDEYGAWKNDDTFQLDRVKGLWMIEQTLSDPIAMFDSPASAEKGHREDVTVYMSAYTDRRRMSHTVMVATRNGKLTLVTSFGAGGGDKKAAISRFLGNLKKALGGKFRFLEKIGMKNNESQPVKAEESITSAKPEIQPEPVSTSTIEHKPTQGIVEQIPSKWKTAKAVTPDGKTEIDVHYEVRDAGDLIASNTMDFTVNPAYPAELQPRNRDSVSNQVQVNGITQNLDPERLAENRETSGGAPIISADGVVESGNGRTLAIQRGYRGNAKAVKDYKKWISQNADRFGLSAEDIAKIKHPVLVRVRDTEMTPQERQDFTVASNRSAVGSMGTVERAAVDARKLTPEMLQKFTSGDIPLQGQTSFLENFVDKVAGESERGSLIGEDGAPTKALVDRAQAALSYAAYGDPALLSRMAESLDDNTKIVSNALSRSAPVLAHLKKQIEAGKISPDLDISKDLVTAANKLSQMRAHGEKWTEQRDQGLLFTGDDTGSETQLPEAVKTIVDLFEGNKNRANRIVEVFSNYGKKALAYGNQEEPGLFAAPEDLDKMSLLKDSVARMHAAHGIGEHDPLKNQNMLAFSVRKEQKKQVTETTQNIDSFFDQDGTPTESALESTSEERRIIRENAKRLGTYKKAPNGQPSNLTNEQWELVRTKDFKRKYGNWEYNPDKKVKIVDATNSSFDTKDGKVESFDKASDLKDWLVDKYIDKTIIIDDDNTPVTFTKRNISASIKRKNQYQIKAYSKLDELIKSSVFGTFEPVDNQGKHRHLSGQDIYYASMKIGDNLYTVRFKIDVNKENLNTIYKDHKVSKIEISRTLYHTMGNNAERMQEDRDIYDMSISSLLGDVKPDLKVKLDSNMEPDLSSLTSFESPDMRYSFRKNDQTPEAAPDIAVAPSPKTDNNPEKRLYSIDNVFEALNKIAPVRYGLTDVPKEVVGYAKLNEEVARTKFRGDADTAIHEVSHILDKRLGLADAVVFAEPNPANAPMFDELCELGRDTSPQSFCNDYDAGGASGRMYLMQEGIAQYLRHLLTNPTYATYKAPTYAKLFAKKLQENPKLRSQIEEVFDVTQGFLMQSTQEKVLASMGRRTQSINSLSLAEKVNLAWIGFRRAWEDRDIDLKIIQESFYKTAVENGLVECLKKDKDGNWHLRDSFAVYNHVRTAPGYMGKAQKDIDALLHVIDGWERDEGGKEKYDKLSAYLKAADAVSGYYDNDMKPGVGVSEAEIRQYVQDMKNADPEVVKAAKALLKAFNTCVDETMVDSGIWSAKKVANWRKRYPDYVPYVRIDENGEPQFNRGGSRSFINTADPAHKRKGIGDDSGYQSTEDPLVAMISHVLTYHRLAEKNRVAQSLVAISTKAPAAFNWVAERIHGGETKGKPHFWVYHSGQKRYYATDKHVMDALQMIGDLMPKNSLDKWLMLPGELLKMGATRYNLAFIPRNFIKDAQFASYTSRSMTPPLINTMHGLAKHILAASGNKKAAALLEKAYKNGLFYSGITEPGLKNTPEAIEKVIQRRLKGGSKLVRTLKTIADGIGQVNESVETAVKVHEFAYLLKKGYPEREAARLAREVNLDFSAGGNWTKYINKYVPFFGPGVLGLSKTIRAVHDAPAKILLKWALYSAPLTLLLWARNKNDKEYDSLPRDMKDNHYVWKVGDSWMRMPKGDQFGILDATLERSLDAAYGLDPDAFSGLMELAWQNIVPNSLLPAFLTPIGEHITGKSFYTFKDIEPKKTQTLPYKMRSSAHTSWLADAVADALPDLITENLKISPIILDNYSERIGGGVLSTAVHALDLVGKRNAPERSAAQQPFLSRFMIDPTYNNENIRRFWNYKDESDKAYNAFMTKARAGKRPEITYQIRAKHVFDKYSKSMSEITKRMNDIWTTEAMKPDAKKKELDRLHKVQNRLASDAMKRFYEFRDK